MSSFYTISMPKQIGSHTICEHSHKKDCQSLTVFYVKYLFLIKFFLMALNDLLKFMNLKKLGKASEASSLA